MIYIESLEHRLVKYEVKIDEDKLCSLRDEITIKHGFHKHKTYKSDKYCTPYDLIRDSKKADDIFINNLRITKIEENGSDKVYYYEYDEYLYPLLAKIINGVLHGQDDLIQILKNGPISGIIDKEEFNIRNELNQLSNKPLDSNTLEELNNLKTRIKDYQKKHNDDLVMKEYYIKAIECMTFTKISSISKDKLLEYNKILREINNFFGKTMCYNDIDKILRK